MDAEIAEVPFSSGRRHLASFPHPKGHALQVMRRPARLSVLARIGSEHLLTPNGRSTSLTPDKIGLRW